MSTYFFEISEVHHMISRYDVCLDKYMDLSVRLRSGTTSEDTKPMRRTRLALTKDSCIFTYFLF